MKSIFAVFTLFLGISSAALADVRVGLNIGYSPSYLANLTGGGTSSGTPYTINYALSYSNVAEFGLDLWSAPQNSWGFISGFQYGGERSLSSGTANGFPVVTAGDTTKFQTHFIYGGWLYRWSSFYLPIGLTYGMTKFTTAAAGITAESKNGFGLQFGIGWFLGDNFVIEYIGRSATTELNLTSNTGNETTTGTIGSANLNLKYFF